MSNIKLPNFLKKVDGYTKEMSHKQLEVFIHEIARKSLENERGSFINLLEKCSRGNIELGSNDDNSRINKQIKDIIAELDKINSGEISLDSEYNQEWDDWYNPHVDEISFMDSENIIGTIKKAMGLLHTCVDRNMYVEGSNLAEILCGLEVDVEGDYTDYDYEPLRISSMVRYYYFELNYDLFFKESIYLIYMAKNDNINEKIEKIYDFFQEYCGSIRVPFEDILAIGNDELPEFDEFLKLWIDYLGKCNTNCAEILFEEACELLNDLDYLENHVKEYANIHPLAYLSFMKNKIKNGDEEGIVDIGLEALDVLADNLVIRSEIALLTAQYAGKVSKNDIKEKCLIEAFISDTNVISYMRVRFLISNYEQYKYIIKEIITRYYNNNDSDRIIYTNRLDSMKTNKISKYDYLTILFFEQHFTEIVEIGMSPNDALGWSLTFMKEGMALFLMLLYGKDECNYKYCEGMDVMLSKAMQLCSFSNKDWYIENINNMERKKDESDKETFLNIFNEWKKSVLISKQEIRQWLKQLEKWISKRVAGIMEANKRNYYDECSSYISALAEVKETLGDAGAKHRLFLQYKDKYPRRRAFHEALRKYGAYF